MTSIKKISWGQLAVLLVASRLFSESVNFPLDNTEYGMQRFTVIVAAYIILFIQYIPMLILTKKYSGESATGLITERNRALGWTAALLVTFSVIVASVSSLCRMKFYASSTIYGQAPPFLLIILPLIVCFFAAWKGIQGTARSGVIFAGVFVGFLILMGVSVWKLMDFKWLYPAFIEDVPKFTDQVLEQIGSNSEIIFFAVLAEHVRDRAHRIILWYVPAVMLLLLLMFLVEITVLGPFLGSASFPFFTVSALSDIVLFQRLDGIDVAVWTLMCIIKLTLALLCIRTVFDRLLGNKGGMIAACIGLLIIGWLSLMYGGSMDFVKTITAILTSGIPMIICGILLPIAALIIAKKVKKEGERKSEQNP